MPSTAFDAIVAGKTAAAWVKNSRLSSIPSAAEATLRLYRPNGEPLVCRRRGLAMVKPTSPPTNG